MKIKYHPSLEPVGRATPNIYIPLLVLIWLLHCLRGYIGTKLSNVFSTVDTTTLAISATGDNASYVWRKFLDGSSMKVLELPPYKPIPKQQFINQSIEASLMLHRDFTSISQKCSSTKWRDDLIFRCGAIDKEIGKTSGLVLRPLLTAKGVGRNQLLHHLRFAIEIGAGIILPKVRLSEDEKDEGTGELSSLFDVEALKTNLKSACPQLPIHFSSRDLAKKAGVRELGSVDFGDIKAERHNDKVLKDPRSWLKEFDRWLADKTDPESAQKDSRSDAKPVEVSQEISTAAPTETITAHPKAELNGGKSTERNTAGAQLDSASTLSKTAPSKPAKRTRIVDVEASKPIWPICHDGEDFANNFGRLLSMTQEVQYLAAATLHRFGTYFQVRIPPTRPILDDTFLAIHFGWASDEDFDGKLRRYIGISKRERLPVIYAATNSRDDLDYLWDRSYPRNVVWKKWFLTPEETKVLEQMPDYTRAIVDYLVSERAGYFFGTDASVLSWTVALSRRRAGMQSATCPDFAIEPQRGAAYVDEWSEIYGSLDGFEEMALAVWP